MAKHDFQKGQSVCMLADPEFQTKVFEIVIGTVIMKGRSPFDSPEEFVYDIKTNDGCIFHARPGIYVYGSVKELYDDVLHDLENEVENSDLAVKKCSKDLADAKIHRSHVKWLHKRWQKLADVYGKADAPSSKGDSQP